MSTIPMRARTLALLVVVAWAPTALTQSSPVFDVLIRGGRLYDGSGNPWVRADVGIRNGMIVAVGDLRKGRAARVIDAAGKVVAPGFIDLHSHSDDEIPAYQGLRAADGRRRAAPNLVSQGVTTLVVNQDGRSSWPIADQRAELRRLGVGPNVTVLVGHGTVRRRIMGEDHRRAATADEISRMRALVRQAMREGAWGLSAGLEYVPGIWSTTDEVVALVEEVVPFGGVYISHQRSEGADPMWYWPSRDAAGPPTLLDAVRETIAIGERTGATVVATHLKAKGANYWGSGSAAVQLIERARARGVSIFADQYPYSTTGSDGATVLIPPWALEGGGEAGGAGDQRDYSTALRHTLSDRTRRGDLERDIQHEIHRRGGADNVIVFEYPDATYIGESLAELARRRGRSPVEMAITLQLEGFAERRGGARLRGFSLSEVDIATYAPRPWVATASDAGIAMPGDRPVHARFYGTFPRKIRRYALDGGVLSVEDAIRSMTSLPAQILGLPDRGFLRAGYRADVVVMDLERIRDRATFFEPHQYASGIEYVLVAGEPVVDEGALTWALPGEVLGRPSVTP